MLITGKVLIVGSGIAGQALAIALAKHNIDCEIVEVRPEWQLLGAGTALLATAMRALDEIGIAEDVRRAGWSHENARFMYRDASGELVVETDVEGAGSGLPAGVSIMRNTLHELLVEKVKQVNIPVTMGTTVESLDNDGEGVDVVFSDGSRSRFSLVVGADGIRSKVRSLLFGLEEPAFSGFAAWRYVIPRPDTVTELNWFWGRNATIGIVPLSSSEMYIAGTSVEPDNPRYERENLPRLFREKFSQFEAEVPKYLEQVVNPDDVVYTPLEEVRLNRSWYEGRVVLVGDAAHASTPFWALGAALALEDVALLARLINEGEDLQVILSQWFKRRLPRCEFVQDGSVATGKQMHSAPGEGPRIFPPPARDAIKRGMQERALKLAEPY